MKNCRIPVDFKTLGHRVCLTRGLMGVALALHIDLVWADNCSSLSDCFSTVTAATLSMVGIAFILFLRHLVDFLKRIVDVVIPDVSAKELQSLNHGANKMTTHREGGNQKNARIIQGAAISLAENEVLPAQPNAGVPVEGDLSATKNDDRHAGNQMDLWRESNAIARVVESGKGYNIVERHDGTIEKISGPRNWRNNNPGNIEAGLFSKKQGAIGTDGRFAIFPDYETGRQAKAALIFESKNYQDLSLSAAIARYAPPLENNTARYQAAVLESVNNSNKRMSEFSYDERQLIMDAMQKQEGFRAGKFEKIP